LNVAHRFAGKVRGTADRQGERRRFLADPRLRHNGEDHRGGFRGKREGNQHPRVSNGIGKTLVHVSGHSGTAHPVEAARGRALPLVWDRPCASPQPGKGATTGKNSSLCAAARGRPCTRVGSEGEHSSGSLRAETGRRPWRRRPVEPGQSDRKAGCARALRWRKTMPRSRGHAHGWRAARDQGPRTMNGSSLAPPQKLGPSAANSAQQRSSSG